MSIKPPYIALFVVLVVCLPVSSALENLTIQATADSFVESNNPTSMYGTTATVAIENHAVYKHSRMYFTFPKNDSVSQLNITSATLSVYATSNGASSTIGYAREVIAITNESNITWNAQPCPSSACNITDLDTKTISSGLQWYTWNVTHAARNASGNITVMIITSELDNEGYRDFNSREATTSSLRPKLDIIYSLDGEFSNNYTNDDSLSVTLDHNRSVNFNISSTIYSASMYSWHVDGTNQSTDFNNFTYNFGAPGTYNVTGIIHNSTKNIVITWEVTLPFMLLTPANGSSLSMEYPPLGSDVYFSWNSVGYDYYQLLVSKNSGFSLLASDTYVSDTFDTISLESGNYWWKVRYYDAGSGSYGPWSDTFNFTLTSSFNTTGTGIIGTVYESLSGGNVPVPGATVYIYNSSLTWSDFQIVGTNGYYEFTGLTNGSVYYVYSIMTGYDSVTPLPKTMGNGNITVYNIQMRRTVNPYIPDYIDATFRLMYLNHTVIYDAITTVYEYGNPIAYDQDTTAFAGTVTFKLDLHQRYNITFEDASGNQYTTTVSTTGIYPKSMNIIYVIDSTSLVTPDVPDSYNYVNNTGNASFLWGISDFTNATLQSNYQIGPKGQGIIMSIIALFMIPYGGIVAMIVIAFGFAYMGLLSYPFVMVSGVFCAAWYLIKKEFT